MYSFYLLYSNCRFISLLVFIQDLFLKAYLVVGTELGSSERNLLASWSLPDDLGRLMMNKLCVS